MKLFKKVRNDNSRGKIKENKRKKNWDLASGIVFQQALHWHRRCRPFAND